MYTWTLGIQHAFGAHTSLTVNYVGTHTYDLASEININQATPGAAGGGLLAPGVGLGTVDGPLQNRLPYFGKYPWFNGIFVYGPAGFSNYNALQVTFVQRNFHGLTLNAGYTFSRDLATPKGGNDPYITNSQCVSCEYGLITPKQDLGVTLVYALPGIKSPGQLLEGWQISSAINIQSGQPFRGTDSSNDFTGVADPRGIFGGPGPEPWSLHGSASNFKLGTLTPVPCYFNDSSPVFPFFSVFGCTPFSAPNAAAAAAACISAANAEPVNAAMNAELAINPATGLPPSSGLASLDATGCYVSGNGKSVILPPAQGTYGNMKVGSLLTAPFHEWDLSLRKTFKVRERLGLEFSVSAFNVLNNTNYALGFLGGIVNVPALFGKSSQDPNNGNPINGTGGPREVLLGLKATF
jgi:hypothetical protein